MPENENIKSTSIDGLYVIERPTFSDERGFFHEIYRHGELKEVTGIDLQPLKMSHTLNKPKAFRGIHSEEWNKLVYPVNGKLFVAIADVRPESKTFLKVETFVFDDQDPNNRHAALFLPSGIGNSLCVVGDAPVHYIYAVEEEGWDNSKAKGIAYDDSDLKIEWPMKDMIVSERDRSNPKLRDLYPEKFK